MDDSLTTMDPILVAARPPRYRAMELLMRVLFRPVFGWSGGDTYDVVRHRIAGLDDSSLCVGSASTMQGPARGVVLLCHPFLKYGMSYFWRHGYDAWLTGAGYHVVAFDFKGFGASKLGGISFGDDVAAVAAWARERYPGLPLHLFGVSFGAFHAIHCLARRRTQFASAVFDSVPASIAEFFRQRWAGAVMRRISASRWGPRTGTVPILASLPALRDLPCLFLYGDQDPFITADEMARVARACPRGQVRVFDNCSHLQIRKCHPAGYAASVLAFMESHAGAGAVQPTGESS